MAKTNQRTFGAVIRERRRRLDLTQEEVARRIRTSTPYIGHLESGKRHPSEKVIARLSDVLGLQGRELFLLANPRARDLLRSGNSGGGHHRSAWDEFRTDERLRRAHSISAEEIDVLGQVAAMGEAHSPRDFIYILNAIRLAFSH